MRNKKYEPVTKKNNTIVLKSDGLDYKYEHHNANKLITKQLLHRLVETAPKPLDRIISKIDQKAFDYFADTKDTRKPKELLVSKLRDKYSPTSKSSTTGDKIFKKPIILVTDQPYEKSNSEELKTIENSGNMDPISNN